MLRGDEPKPDGREDLLRRLEALLPSVRSVDPAKARDAEAALARRHPLDGPDLGAIRRLCEAGLEAGWLCPRAAGPSVKFGRLAKDFGGYALDAVWMRDGAGLGHTHTRGEINICYPLEGEPRFDGREPGWVVFPPGSHHVPTVTGGTMLFLYFTPGGEVVWDR
jgi:hypothetical protein